MLQNPTTGTVHNGQSDNRGGWELVGAAQRGDRQAFGRLYQRYAGEVSRVVMSRTGDRSLAQDLTSETFLRAWRRIDSVSDQGRDVGAWLSTIARNLTVDHVKSSRYRREQTTADIPDRGRVSGDDRGPEQAVIEKETAAEIRSHLQALPPDQRECLRLRFWQGLSRAETAAVMGRTGPAVSALQHRALGALRATLAAHGGPVPPAREGPDPLMRARRAVAELAAQRRTGADRHAAAQRRTQQLTQWRDDDQALAREVDRGVRALAGADGLGVA